MGWEAFVLSQQRVRDGIWSASRVEWFCRMIDSFSGHLRYEGSLCPSPWQCEFPLWSLSCDDLKAILGPLPSISICGHSHSGSLVCRLTQSHSHWCEGSFGALSHGNFFFSFCLTGSALVPTAEFRLPVFAMHWLLARGSNPQLSPLGGMEKGFLP